MCAFNVRFKVERNGFTLTRRGKLYFDVMMKRANTMAKKKGREEDELIFKGTVEPFYSSAHPVTPAVLHRCYSFRFVINCAFRYHLCDEYDSLSLSDALSLTLSLSLSSKTGSVRLRRHRFIHRPLPLPPVSSLFPESRSAKGTTVDKDQIRIR